MDKKSSFSDVDVVFFFFELSDFFLVIVDGPVIDRQVFLLKKSFNGKVLLFPLTLYFYVYIYIYTVYIYIYSRDLHIYIVLSKFHSNFMFQGF